MIKAVYQLSYRPPAGGDSSVGRLMLVERFAVRKSPLAFFADAPYMCGSQKRSGKIILGVS